MLFFRVVLSERSLLVPNMSSVPLGHVSHFSCEVYCHESLLVTWLLNGTFLSELGLFSGMPGVTLRSDRALQCSANRPNMASMYTATLEVFPESLDPFTVQCAAVYVCGDGDEATECRSRVCYGPLIHVEGEGPVLYSYFSCLNYTET